jgi:hypothetical protein
MTLEHAFVLGSVAVRGREADLLHPLIFLREVFERVGVERVEARQHVGVARLLQRVQVRHELPVSLVHLVHAQFERARPFHRRHRAETLPLVSDRSCPGARQAR